MRLRREEKETHIWTNEAAADWEIETCSPRVWAKLDKMFKATEVMRDHGRIYGKIYQIPPPCVSFRRVVPPRMMSEAQRGQVAKLVEARRLAREGKRTAMS